MGHRTSEAIRNPWASDEGYEPPLRHPRRRRPARYLGAALIVAGVAAGIWLTQAPGSLPGGDPGGRILAQIAPVGSATPADVTVNYRHLSEPRIDSCDGRASTRGWSLAVVQVNFDWNGTPPDVISLVGQRLRDLGWAHPINAQENFLPAQQWDKQLSDGKKAYTHLEAAAGGRTWTLITFAQPEGRQVSGC